MDVPVEESGGDALAFRVYDARAFADAVVGRTEVGDATFGDGHVDALLDFARAHVHELRALDDRVGGRAALGDGDERFRALP